MISDDGDTEQQRIGRDRGDGNDDAERSELRRDGHVRILPRRDERSVPRRRHPMAHPKKIVQPDDLPVRKTHSQVVTVAGGTLVFVAGMTSRSEKDASPVHPGDMRAQVRQVCQNIGRALRSVGADFSDVVKTTTFTTDVEEYHRVADERFKYFTRDLPTSALIGVQRLSAPELMVEIEAMAVIPARGARATPTRRKRRR